MTNLNTLSLLAAGTCALTVASMATAGVVSLTGNSYSQNFQTFGTGSVTNAVVPALTMTEASTLTGGGTVTGWYVYGQGYTTTNTKWIPQDTGTYNYGGFRSMYSLASGNTGNYAFGAQGSASATPLYYGVVIQNNTGADITGATISFEGFMNRYPSSTVNTTSFSYLISSTALATAQGALAGTFSGSAGSWKAVSGLGFSTPSTGIGAPRDPQNVIQPMLSLGNKSAALSGFRWASGAYLYLRWTDLDETGNDATMGVDNFSISVPAPGALTLLGVAGVLGARKRR